MNLGRRIRAFTLVELLVVIGIIALLISILLPALSKAREQALIVSCSAQLKDFNNAILLYAQDNKQGFPGPIPGRVYSGYYKDSGLLQNFLWRYLKMQDPATAPDAAHAISSKLTLCPGYRAKQSGTNSENFLCTYVMFAYDPWSWVGYSGGGTNSYMYSPLQNAKYGHPTSGPYNGNVMPLKLSQVFDASEQPFMGDLDNGEKIFEGGSNLSYLSEYPNHGGKAETKPGVMEQSYPASLDPNQEGSSPYFTLVAGGTSTNPPRNVLFCDGHVATQRQSGPPIPGDLARYGPPPSTGPFFHN